MILLLTATHVWVMRNQQINIKFNEKLTSNVFTIMMIENNGDCKLNSIILCWIYRIMLLPCSFSAHNIFAQSRISFLSFLWICCETFSSSTPFATSSLLCIERFKDKWWLFGICYTMKSKQDLINYIGINVRAHTHKQIHIYLKCHKFTQSTVNCMLCAVVRTIDNFLTMLIFLPLPFFWVRVNIFLNLCPIQIAWRQPNTLASFLINRHIYYFLNIQAGIEKTGEGFGAYLKESRVSLDDTRKWKTLCMSSWTNDEGPTFTLD